MARKTRQKPIPLPDQYSADIVRSDGDVAKIFIDGIMRRTESCVGGKNTLVISRPDLKVIYTVFPDDGVYITSPIDSAMLSALQNEDIDEEWEYVGEETVDTNVVQRFNAFLRGQSQAHRVIYLDRQTNVRVKTVTLNRKGEEVLTVLTRNVTIGRPASSVFELPPGLKESQ